MGCSLANCEKNEECTEQPLPLVGAKWTVSIFSQCLMSGAVEGSVDAGSLLDLSQDSLFRLRVGIDTAMLNVFL